MINRIWTSVIVLLTTLGSAYAEVGQTLNVDLQNPKLSAGQAASQNDTAKLASDGFIDPDIPVSVKGNFQDTELLLYMMERDQLDGKKRELMKKLYEEDLLREIREEQEARIRRKVFNEIKEGISTFTPSEIKDLRSYDLEIEKAKNEPIVPVKQVIRTIEVDNNSPDSITVNVDSVNSATVVFYDRAGNPWPIQGNIIHNDGYFNASITGEHQHVAVFTLKEKFLESNAVVNLKSMSLPIVLKLVGDGKHVDARLSIRLPTIGPNMDTKPRLYQQMGNASNEMLQLLNGDDLGGSYRYRIDTIPDAEAYYLNRHLYIRTKALLLNPPPLEAASLPNSYNAYKIPAKQHLTFSVDGKRVFGTVVPVKKVELVRAQSLFPKE